MLDQPSSSIFLKYLISNSTTLFQSIQVAKNIQVVYTSRSAAILISLDMKIIEDAHLNIDANTVKQSILQSGNLKLKSEVKSKYCNNDFFFPIMPLIFKTFVMQNIKVLDMKKLQVDARVANRSEILFQLNNLKNLLPSVVVKVYLCVCMYMFYFLDS